MSSSTTVAFLAFLLDWIATAMNQIAFAISKVSHMDEEKRKSTQRSDQTIQKQLFCSLKGICSLLCTIIGSLGHFAALPFCDLTLIACNSSSAVVMNVFISWKWLGEKFVPLYDITAMLLVFTGTIFIIVMSNKEQQTFTTDKILDLITTPQSIAYFSVTIGLAIAVHMVVPVLLKRLKAFEKDCEQWEARNAPNMILPEKKRAIDDEEIEADRPDRVVADILYGLPRESVQEVSPQSMATKAWLKVPLLMFTILSAMVSSISEMIMKIIGCILMEAEDWTDYMWLLLFLPLLGLTATRTLVYVNYGIKYYDQMEVMPIYQTNLLIHNILVGMICLNELQFYSLSMLGAIAFSSLLNLLGIYILLQKKREKRDMLVESEDVDTLAVQLLDDSCQAMNEERTQEGRSHQINDLSQSFENDQNKNNDLHLKVNTLVNGQSDEDDDALDSNDRD